MTDLQQQCEYLAEHLLGWKWISNKTGSVSLGTPFWRTPQGRKFGNPITHINTAQGMLEIIEAMRGKGSLEILETTTGYAVTFYGDLEHSASLPEAIIRAAFSAMKGNE